MSLSAAALRLLAEKGLSAADIVELAEVLEVRRDPTAAERMRRHRARRAEGVTVTRNVTPVTETAPPNDIYLTPLDPSEANASEPPFSEKVVSAWNDGPAKRGARKANKLDAARTKALNLRRREHGDEAVFAAIRGIAASDWHCGIGSNGWRADIGWMLKSPENFLKAVERAGDVPANDAKPMTADDRAAYLRKLDEKPHLRGVNTPGAPPGPRGIGPLAAGIASNLRHLAHAGTA